jgi:hypothetical protein
VSVRRNLKKLAQLSPTPLPESVTGGYYVRGDVADGLAATAKAMENDVTAFYKWMHDVKVQIRESISNLTLVSKEEAASILGLSVAGVGRKMKSRALKVVYIDARPRFKLSELARFIDAHEKDEPRRRRRK